MTDIEVADFLINDERFVNQVAISDVEIIGVLKETEISSSLVSEICNKIDREFYFMNDGTICIERDKK